MEDWINNRRELVDSLADSLQEEGINFRVTTYESYAEIDYISFDAHLYNKVKSLLIKLDYKERVIPIFSFYKTLSLNGKGCLRFDNTSISVVSGLKYPSSKKIQDLYKSIVLPMLKNNIPLYVKSRVDAAYDKKLKDFLIARGFRQIYKHPVYLFMKNGIFVRIENGILYPSNAILPSIFG